MGTLTSDVAAAVKELLAGKLEYRVSRDKQMRLVVGRVSARGVEGLWGRVSARTWGCG